MVIFVSSANILAHAVSRQSGRSFIYNGGQKCWDLSSDVTKSSDPSPPTPNKVGFGANWVKMSAFFWPQHCKGKWRGGRRDEPKAEQKIVLRSRVLRNYFLVGLFHTVPSSFVLHCSTED